MFPKIVKALGAFRSEVILGGVLSYSIAKAASSDGKKILVTGEGVDVIFGGLSKYKITPKHHLYNVMIEDQHKLWHSTNRRMDHVAMLCGVEPRAPLEDLRVIAKARHLPVKKILDFIETYFSEDLSYFKNKNKVKINLRVGEGLGLQDYTIEFKSKSSKSLEKVEKVENLLKILEDKVDIKKELLNEKKINFKRKKFKKKKIFKKKN